MDAAHSSRPPDAAAAAWPYPAVRPQRYSTAYAAYLKRAGLVKVGELARRYSPGEILVDPVRFFQMCHVFDQIHKEGLEGDIAEVGVYKGDTGALLAEFGKLLGKHVYLCDTFEGFNKADFTGLDDGRNVHFGDTSVEAVRTRLGGDNVHMVKGYFPDSASALPASGRYCLVHIDCDLYKPIFSSLEYFYPRLVPGGFMIVHDYGSLKWDGAEKAVDDFFAGAAESVVPIPDSAGSVIIRKMRAADGRDDWRRQRKRLPVGDWISPANGGLAAILDSGWSRSEPWGVWGVGEEHVLSFSPHPARSRGALELSLDLRAALAGTRRAQSVDVEIDGKLVSTVHFTQASPRTVHTTRIDPAPPAGTVIRVRFAPRSTESPHELDASLPDTRRLGVALHRLRLREG